MLFGVTDLTLLISIAMANATMNILGLFQEKYNNIRDPDAVIDWVWTLDSVRLSLLFEYHFLSLIKMGDDLTDNH